MPEPSASSSNVVGFAATVNNAMLTYARGRLKIHTRERIQSSVMENRTETKVHIHYNHTDSCKYARWTARECYLLMYSRPWQQVLDFYSSMVNDRDRLSLLGLFGTERSFYSQSQLPTYRDDAETIEANEENELFNVTTKSRSGRWARETFKIVLSYHGASFDGWQRQPGLNTVQGLIERSLGKFVDENKAQKLKERSLPVEGCATVAGRTDKGVTALQQVCSFYTWRRDVKTQDIEDAINSATPEKLRVVSVTKVSRAFHPNFSAKWRRYFYIFPLSDVEEQRNKNKTDKENHCFNDQHGELRNGCDEYLNEDKSECLTINDEVEFDSRKKPSSFSVTRVNQLLLQLEGKSLSYKVFARDTKASRSIGPPTDCHIYHARAAEAKLPCPRQVDGEGIKVMCVELVANRFLRKMVRVLVATSIREAAAGADDDALIKLMDATCRRATAPPAPPDGLCLLDVGYTEFNPKNCLIL